MGTIFDRLKEEARTELSPTEEEVAQKAREKFAALAAGSEEAIAKAEQSVAEARREHDAILAEIDEMNVSSEEKETEQV